MATLDSILQRAEELPTELSHIDKSVEQANRWHREIDSSYGRLE